MAIRPTRTDSRNRRNSGVVTRSGAAYRTLSLPASAARCTRPIPSKSIVLLMKAAGTPLPRSASTWSFISAMSGDTTSVSPSIAIAGSW